MRLKEVIANNLDEEEGESVMASLAKVWWDEGLHEGIQKGKVEGKLEGLHEVAVNMLRQGMDLDVISQVTGIPLIEVKKLKLRTAGV